jgi:hypothetical protein
MNVKPKKTAEEMREYKRDWAREHSVTLTRPAVHSNQNVGKTTCIRGHEFTEENTIIKTQDGKEHRTCRECHLQDQLKRQRKDMQHPVRRETLRKRRKKASFKRIGWTLERFEEVWEEQGGRCAIPSCNKLLSREVSSNHADKAYADHEHIEPPKPRGILCQGCNLGLGLLRENVKIMEDLIVYVKKWGACGS